MLAQTALRVWHLVPSSAAAAAAPQVPFLFKYAIDGLTMDPSGATAVAAPMAQLVPATVLLGYGAARAGSALCNEVRNAIFAKVRHAHVSCGLMCVTAHCSVGQPMRAACECESTTRRWVVSKLG